MKIIITKEDFEVQNATLSEIIASLCAGFVYILTMPEVKDTPELQALIAIQITEGVKTALHLGLHDEGESKTPEKFEAVDVSMLEKLAKKMKEKGGE